MVIIRLRDLTGLKFGSLKVLCRAENLKDRVAWNCICDCGKPAVVRGCDLTAGHTKTCGHGISIGGVNRKKKDDKFSEGRLVRIYHNMKQRCLNPNNKLYPDYGGRGIKICKKWLGSKGLENFYSWSLENGYEKTLTIDRINVNGNYKPSNCRWATNEVQVNNRRNTLYVTIGKERKSITQWERELSIPKDVLRRLINNEILGKKLLKSLSKITYDNALHIEISI